MTEPSPVSVFLETAQLAARAAWWNGVTMGATMVLVPELIALTWWLGMHGGRLWP